MQYSLGELIDKLIIEQIKIYRIRERLHTDILSKNDKVDLNEKMMLLNDNRTMLIKAIDNKIESLQNGEQNTFLKTIRTYGK
jgi:hypothetical protein